MTVSLLADEVYNDLHELDLKNLMWTNLTVSQVIGKPPTARRGAGCTTCGNYMFMFGGINADGNR
jgi:hypothetical protein